MKKLILFLLVAVFVGFVVTPIYSANGPGPAPNSGDGIPDGPGEGWPPSPGPQTNK